jgi:transketolase
MTQIELLTEKAREVRESVMRMCIAAGTGHCTSSLSLAEVMVTLYWGGFLRCDPKNPKWEGRDKLFLSKGQASPIQYVVLAKMGFFPESHLDGFAQKRGKFGVHLQKSVPGVEATSGSLGHGLGIAAGGALAALKNRRLNMYYAILGDGECYEGAIWETAMFASHNRLNNLVAIIDRNYQCVTDFTENIVSLEPMEKRWEAFGWNVKRIDGHSISEIAGALHGLRRRPSPRPTVIISDTTKGKGVDFMENVPLWHGLAPNGELASSALEQLKGGK